MVMMMMAVIIVHTAPAPAAAAQIPISNNFHYTVCRWWDFFFFLPLQNKAEISAFANKLHAFRATSKDRFVK